MPACLTRLPRCHCQMSPRACLRRSKSTATPTGGTYSSRRSGAQLLKRCERKKPRRRPSGRLSKTMMTISTPCEFNFFHFVYLAFNYMHHTCNVCGGLVVVEYIRKNTLINCKFIFISNEEIKIKVCVGDSVCARLVCLHACNHVIIMLLHVCIRGMEFLFEYGCNHKVTDIQNSHLFEY